MPSPFNEFWYRIAPLKPRLRQHMEIHRHRYRGRLWYVLQDHSSQRQHRFSPAAYNFIALFDGRRTVGEVWTQTEARLGDQMPTQDEVVQLLAQLHSADALQCDVPADVAELLSRRDRELRQDWQGRFLNPLCWRLALFDPESVLTKLLPFVRPLSGRAGTLLWLAVVFMATVQAVVHWSELTQDVADRVLTGQNLVWIWLLFPLLKFLHELGHGIATKVYGGEVHEMGVLLLAFQPLPYVDASAASAFRSKRQRIVVGAAGMMVEVFVASLALFLWLNVEPGVVRTLAYNIMFIAGFSTVLFNANPLMRYDGYYILADYLEMPNLRTRAHAHLRHLCESYLFGRHESVSEPTTAPERIWLTAYPLAAFVYRCFVLAAIAVFISAKFFFLGVLLVLVAIALWIVVPLIQWALHLYRNPRIQSVRRRAMIAIALPAIAVLITIFFVPLPLRTRAEGVVWIPEQSRLRASSDCFIEQIIARPGSRVRPGDVLIVSSDPQLTTRVHVLEARLEELHTRYLAQLLLDMRQAQVIKDEINHVEERLVQARARVSELTIRSRTEGIFEIPGAENLPGRFVRQGTALGYVLDFSALTARVVVPQAKVDLVRQRTQNIEVRLVDHPRTSFSTVLKREVPAASEQLPAPALGGQGGGTISVHPLDDQGVRALEKMFQFDLALPTGTGITRFGGRVFVRFDHGWEPLLLRWHRTFRQLFLSKFNV